MALSLSPEQQRLLKEFEQYASASGDAKLACVFALNLVRAAQLDADYCEAELVKAMEKALQASKRFLDSFAGTHAIEAAQKQAG